MNINNLIPGQTIKNYKELCSILNIKVAAGNTRTKQLKELEQYCSFYKDGNKFIIDEIYKIPLEKIDKRKNNSPEYIYKDNIKTVILSLLLQHDLKQKETCRNISNTYNINCTYNERFIISKSNLMKCCGMFGEFYYTYLNKKSTLAEALGIKKLYVNDAYNCDFKTNGRIIDSALKQLSNERVIEYNNIYLFKTFADPENSIAEDNQISNFLTAEHEVLKEMELKNLSLVYLKRRESEFESKVIKYLNERIINDEITCFDDEIISYNRLLNIRYANTNILLETLQEQLQNNLQIDKQELKTKILHSLENTLTKVNQKSKHIQNKKGYDYLRSKDDYVTIVMEVIKIITEIEKPTNANFLPKLNHLIISSPKKHYFTEQEKEDFWESELSDTPF